MDPAPLACIATALDILKQGGGVVDIHPLGIRVRAPAQGAGMWSIGAIPQSAQAEYAESLSERASAPGAGDDPNFPPMTGEGAAHGSDTPEVGLAPEDARD